jgi:6-phosphogluconolactonase
MVRRLKAIAQAVVDEKAKICVQVGLENLSRAAAEFFTQIAGKCVSSKLGRFTVALSGGQTPLRTYQLLSESPYRELISWENTYFFWGDERCVPKDDPRNNAHMAREMFLDHVPVPRDHIHPIPTELPPDKAAEEYEMLLRKFFRKGPLRFDLIFLGLGEDGHTASLFPNSSILEERARWVKEVLVPEQHMHRVSLTVPALVEASATIFLVQGANKSRALREVLEGPYRPHEYPAQLIRPARGQLVWLVDEDAARDLKNTASCPVP